MVVREILFMDVAQNWWVVATIVAVVSLVLSLRRGPALRNALINVFVGFPAAIWMLGTQGAILMGGLIPLYLSISMALGHVGVAISNFLSAALVQPVDVDKGEGVQGKRYGAQGKRYIRFKRK